MKCVYCKSNVNITREHVIPKGLFPKPRPGNLIIVPACKSCNNSKSSEDEYLINTLNIAYQVRDNPSVVKNNDKIMRAISRPQKANFRLEFVESSDYLNKKFNNDIDSNIPVFLIDPDKICNSITNIVIGLSHHIFNGTLNTTGKIETFWLNYTKNINIRNELSILDEIPWQVLGDGVFGFKCGIDNKTNSTIWLTKIYEHFVFVTTIIEK